jgi:hypothetical protein
MTKNQALIFTEVQALLSKRGSELLFAGDVKTFKPLKKPNDKLKLEDKTSFFVVAK